MNKTVNINLSGIFFHIDEDAYIKLKNYLDAVKQSFSTIEGQEEIIQDIEARIAELFSEKVKNERQVVNIAAVEDVIEIMGQPEDYKVDETLFEDEEEPQKKQTSFTAGKLYRDTDNTYISGVCSGLGHYFSIDPIWVRLLFVILTLSTGGSLILAYIIFWIFVPEATTTAQKLEMRGEPINISNIERKVREGFDNVAGKVKDVDYKKYGEKVNSGATTFINGLANFIKSIFTIIAKFVAIIILCIAGCALIALLFSLLGIGTFGLVDAPWMDYVEVVDIGAPLWLASIFAFLAVGIPFFFLFVLGLKILISNLKSVGTPTKLILVGIWLISVFILSFLGIRQATEHAFDGKTITTQELPITANDTLSLKMNGNTYFGNTPNHNSGFEIKYDENGNKILYAEDILLNVQTTKKTTAYLEVEKFAEGKSHKQARSRAEAIKYNLRFQQNNLLLDAYFTTSAQNAYRNQKVILSLYLPEQTMLYTDKNTASFHHYNSLVTYGKEEHYLNILLNESICTDCNSKKTRSDSLNNQDSTKNWYSEENDTLSKKENNTK